MRYKTFPIAIAFLLIGVILMGTSGCGKDDQVYLFEVDHAFDVTIPAGQSTITDLVFPFEHLSSLIAGELNNRGLNADDITAIQTSRARLDLVSFEGDLSDLRAVIVNTYSGPVPSNPYEAGYTIQIRDESTDRIDIIPSLTDLKDVLRLDVFNMELVMKFRRIAPRPMQARFTISFGVVE